MGAWVNGKKEPLTHPQTCQPCSASYKPPRKSSTIPLLIQKESTERSRTWQPAQLPFRPYRRFKRARHSKSPDLSSQTARRGQSCSPPLVKRRPNDKPRLPSRARAISVAPISATLSAIPISRSVCPVALVKTVTPVRRRLVTKRFRVTVARPQEAIALETENEPTSAYPCNPPTPWTPFPLPPYSLH